MLRIIAMAIVIGLVVFSGVVAGLWTNRWGLSLSVEEAAARLQEVPTTLEGWESTPVAVPERALQIGEIGGHYARRFINRRTGAAVSVLMVVGRAGPITVHTADICYPGGGWQQIGRTKYQHGDRLAQFDVLDLTKSTGTLPTQLRIYMAMGSKGAWSYPDNPRLAFAGQSALYKIYVTYEAPKLDDPVEKGPAVELIQALLPQLQEKLFGGK